MSDVPLSTVTIPSSPVIGWIGTGIMGGAMCSHYLSRGYPVIVFTRTPAKAASLLNNGAQCSESPQAVATSADVIFSMVGFPSDVEEVYFGQNGLLHGAVSSKIFVDMTTSTPSLARKIYDAARVKGAHALDAPVSGGNIGAKEGTLSIMVGGDEEVVRALHPHLEILGKTVVYQGGPGSGQHTKATNQIACAGTLVGVCESLLYGYRAGLQLETMLKSIGGGAAASWTLDHLAPRILDRNFDPGFFVEHFVKDMKIALDEAQRMGLVLPGLALVHQLYLAVKAQGHEKAGTQALMLALESLSNVQISPSKEKMEGMKG